MRDDDIVDISAVHDDDQLIDRITSGQTIDPDDIARLGDWAKGAR